MGEFRRDPITGRWVIIAAERARRPRRLGSSNQQSETEPCPFCAGNETMTPPEVWAERADNGIENSPGWTVRVVPNKYPALAADGEQSKIIDRFYESQAGLGAHEVIIESPNHDVTLAGLNEDQFGRILRAYRARLRAVSQDCRWRYALLYKNQGDYAGATLEHIHSQLIAMPTVPQAAQEELNWAKEHYQATGRCVYCAIIEREIRQRERLVFEHESFIALCPFAPRFAYETWLLPKAHSPEFMNSHDEVNGAFARALGEILRRLQVALGDPPFNYFIHSMPLDDGAASHYHWQLRILPQLARAAGFEWGSGAHINSVAPEAAAELLRDALL
ncbi:MAG: galactose-1-phosphate uridylyltransferase [Candidatus Binatia bacterium]